MILPASYANGFAPRDGQPLYPELWRGCVGAWAPCLGPTGLTLRDWSGFGKNGTLTNMTADTAWTLSDGRHALLWDATNDFVTFPLTTLAVDFSVSTWINFTSVTGSNRVWISRNLNGLSFIGTLNSSTVISVRTETSGFASFTVPTLVVGTLYHILLVRSGTTARLFLNGRESTSGAQSLTGTMIFDNFGYQNTPSFAFDGRLLDAQLFDWAVPAWRGRPGMAFELAPRRRSSVQVAAFNRRRRLLVGAGS